MRTLVRAAGALTVGSIVLSCVSPRLPLDRPIETSVAFTNLSTQYYATFSVRAADRTGAGEYVQALLLPPGAVYRARWLDLLGTPCPAEVDLRLALYRRVNDTLPIGLDEVESVEPIPLAAGQALNVPACRIQELETYTVVNWDAPAGQARVKIAQGTEVETALRDSEFFGNAEGLWSFEGVDPAASPSRPPPLHSFEPIAGRVVTAGGRGVPDVVVLLRTRFRVRADDHDPNNDPDAGYGLPIDFRVTDASGAFSFLRPPGAYQVEFASDDYLFRPAALEIESPVEAVLTVVEPVQ